MKAVLLTILFIIILGLGTYYLILWNAKRKLHINTVKQEKGEGFWNEEKVKRKKKRKKHFYEILFAVVLGIVAFMIVGDLKNRNKRKK